MSKIEVACFFPGHGVVSTGWTKNGPFLNVDNFAMVSGRKACDMSKVCKFCLEKSVKPA